MAESSARYRLTDVVAQARRPDPETREVAKALFTEHLDLAAIRKALGQPLPASETHPPEQPAPAGPEDATETAPPSKRRKARRSPGPRRHCSGRQPPPRRRGGPRAEAGPGLGRHRDDARPRHRRLGLARAPAAETLAPPQAPVVLVPMPSPGETALPVVPVAAPPRRNRVGPRPPALPLPRSKVSLCRRKHPCASSPKIAARELVASPAHTASAGLRQRQRPRAVQREPPGTVPTGHRRTIARGQGQASPSASPPRRSARELLAPAVHRPCRPSPPPLSCHRRPKRSPLCLELAQNPRPRPRRAIRSLSPPRPSRANSSPPAPFRLRRPSPAPASQRPRAERSPRCHDRTWSSRPKPYP